MLAQLADLLRGRAGRRLDVATVPADVLMQASLVLRGLGATVARLDLDAGTLEARLTAGAVLRLSAEPDGDGSRVEVTVDGRDWGGVARTLAHELARGGVA
jgi:hypothetical protein